MSLHQYRSELDRLAQNELQESITNVIPAYENGGFGAGQTPREYAESLAAKIMREAEPHAR